MDDRRPRPIKASEITHKRQAARRESRMEQRTQERLQSAPAAVSRTCGATTDTAIHYTYNLAGRLRSYRDQNGTVGYTYDGAGQRTSTVFPTQTGVTETVGYNNAGDGQLHLHRRWPGRAHPNRPDNPTVQPTRRRHCHQHHRHRNLHRTPTGQLNTLRGPSGDYYYITDPHGTVLALIDTNGNTAATYTYTPYGAPTNTPTGIGATNPYRYNSGYSTPNGLIHYQARYYNPTTGTWTQPDPTGQSFAYTYTGDNPINNVDPSGASLFGTIVGVTAGVLDSAAFIVGAVTTAPLGVGVLGSTAFAVEAGALACTLISC